VDVFYSVVLIMTRQLIVYVVLMLVVANAWALVDFSRYRVIIERRPFAPIVPEEPEESQSVVTLEKPPAFVKDIRVCAFAKEQDRLRVGFVSMREKPPKSYYLFIGEEENGIELVDADYEKEGALLRKGGEQYWLYMGDVPSVTPSKASVKRGPGTRNVAPSLSHRASRRVVPSSSIMGSQSYADRKRKHLEELKQKRKISQAARDRREAEIDKRLQKYQMELIRHGETPLPIPLSEEAEKQLIQEGVLSPE
jgi:hypothetical protein